MEIDVTDYIRETEHWEISGSAAELGRDAGRITWRNAMREAEHRPLLTTPEQIVALRNHAREYGAWTREAIDAWTAQECNAFMAQEVSHAWREIEAVASDDDGEIDWSKAREASEAGCIGGSLYRGDIEGTPGFGRLFYYLGV